MKKIGIITYHFAINYGAVLQCFALQKYLVNKGYKVDILNFESEKQKNNNSIIKVNKGIKGCIVNFLMLPFLSYRKNKNNKFYSFRKSFLNETERIVDLPSLSKYIEKNNYEFIISGSDQVFNPNIEDYDDAFVFPFETKAKKISYAASIGSASKEQLVSLRENIRDFYKLSLREEKDKKVFCDVVDKKVEICCDPVFLLNKKEWLDSVAEIKNNKLKKKYILCYFLHKEYMKEELKKAKEMAKKRNLKLVIINARFNKYSFSKNAILDCGPTEFLSLIYNADYVCTDSFHGLAFSILFNKNFTCFDSCKNKNDSRRANLLSKIGLAERLFNVEERIINENDIDYSLINKKIDEFSEASKEYLDL